MTQIVSLIANMLFVSITFSLKKVFCEIYSLCEFNMLCNFQVLQDFYGSAL